MNANLEEAGKSSGRLIRLPELQRVHLPLSRTTIWRLIRDAKFPKPIPISARAVAWDEAQVNRAATSPRQHRTWRPGTDQNAAETRLVR
jgi:predicted DNA-binding transcriptional regulator AlpA